MKRCPTCGLILDDSQTFCTNDGTPLVADQSSYDLGATLVAPPGVAPSTQPPQAPPQAQQTGWQSPARPTAPQMFSPVADLHQTAGNRPSKLVPGLIGGIVTGILAIFASFLSVTAYIGVSLLCIVWAMVGGAVASKIYVGRSPTPVRTGEGAVVGVVAGAFGALVYLTLDTLVAYALQAQDIEVFYRMQGYSNVTAGIFFAVTGFFGAIFIFGMSIVGGIIGAAMFESRKSYPMGGPPPPPGYGNPMSGSYR